LDPAWAVRPITASYSKAGMILVLEDPGGEPLARLIQGPMEMMQFLRLAVELASVLSRMHRRGLVHKDFKPSNVLVDSASGQVRLMGFGIAARLRRERQAPEFPEVIAGTLAYIAPEQTGRMNRSIDSQSDLYAFGVSLYEMLTGDLPFTASAPMEWVHCHIARHPIPPSERHKNILGPVFSIIMKLLAKNAEERYQSAAGAENDLRRCLAEWDTARHIDEFHLGEHDNPDRLLIPEKLYGRSREIDILLAAFDRVVASGTRSWYCSPDILALASPQSSMNSIRYLFRRGASLHQVNSTSISAIYLMLLCRRPFRALYVRCWAIVKLI
jgi:serine/threonine protein kinase